MKTYTIATYNLRHGAGMDNIIDFDRQIGVISRINPDVIALQEVDRFTARCGKVDEIEILAKGLSPLSNYHFSKSIDYDGGDYGNAILSIEKPCATSVVNMPEKYEPRSIAVCEFEDFVFCSTHLTLHEEYRMRSLELFREIVASTSKPVIFAGDWNANPSSEFIKAMHEDFLFLSNTDLPTFRADGPTKCIDYIAVDAAHASSIKVISAEVIPEAMASDHQPVVVKIELL